MTLPRLTALTIIACSAPLVACAQGPQPVARFDSMSLEAGGPTHQALDLGNMVLGSGGDFSVQFWLRTTAESDRRMVMLSQKRFADNSLASQKNAGWVFYVSDGTWAWSMGSGTQRITYERENGQHMPLNDGQWHQLTMTYDSTESDVRLFYDGVNKVVYNVDRSTGFDFTNTEPVVVGWDPGTAPPSSDVLPAIQTGAETLQALVDEFNRLGVASVASEEFVDLIADPERLFERKGGALASVDFDRVRALGSELMRNPYTVHQIAELVRIAPVGRVFSLVDGTVTIDATAAAMFAARERLDRPEFDMENLAFLDRALSPDDVLSSYAVRATPEVVELDEEVTTLTAAAWNIWHGGKHFTIDDDGWDSRVRIAEMIREEGVDVVMMQETYSSGDFIAAELGYYFATTVDRDYLNQGANISVLSRYPIKELHVQEDSAFMNVGVKLALSETQDLYAMSNWYGMAQFPAVFDFHEARFQESDTIPTLFAGDFNDVPPSDGGNNPATPTLFDAGFTDAFRETFPDPQAYPGHTHRSGRRIDQLYYKGAGLTNASTKVISTWPTGFPSDHFMIISTFDVDYRTPTGGR